MANNNDTLSPVQQAGINKLVEDRKKALQGELDLLEAQYEIEGKRKDTVEYHLEQSRLNSAEIEKQLKESVDLLTIVEKGSEEYEDQLAVIKEINKSLNEERNTQDSITTSLENQKQLEQEREQIINTSIGLAENLAQQFGFAGKNANSINRAFSGIEKQLLSSVKSGKKLSEAFKGMAAGAKEAYTSVFSLGTMMGRTTGGIFEAASMTNKAGEALVGMGYSMEEAAKITKAADAEFLKVGGTIVGLGQRLKQLDEQGMTNLKESLGTDMIKKLDLAAKAGMDFGDATQFLNQQMTQMGKPLNVALDELGDLQALSKDLGQDLGKTTKDWVKFSDRINQFGPKSQKVFKRLAELSKASGIEMGKLFEIARGFDTIEGAAEATARLNVVLGTQLDSIELNQMSDDARIDTIREAIKAQTDWTQLTAAQVRVVEQSIPGGLKINEIMGLTNDVTVTGTDLAKDRANALTEAAQLGADAVNNAAKIQNQAMAKMRATMEAMGIDVVIDQITQAWSELSIETQLAIEFILSGIGTLALFAGTIGTLGMTTSAAGTAIGGGAIAAGGGIGTGLTSASVGLAAFGVAGKVAIPVLLTLAAVALAIGIAVGLAAAGMALLVHTISGAAADKLMAFGAMMSEILLSINPIGMIFIGIKKVVEQVGKTFEVVARSAGSFADAIVRIADAAAGMTLSSMAGWARFATNLSEVVGAINDIEIDEMEAFRKTLNVVVAGVLGTGANAPGSSVQGNVTVQVIMDNDVFARAVSKIVDNKLNGLPATSP